MQYTLILFENRFWATPAIFSSRILQEDGTKAPKFAKLKSYTRAMGDIFEGLLPLLKEKAHCVINVPDMWWENQRITIHVSLIEELRKRGYELRNVIIWDRTNVVNGIGIFGWPSNYITMGVTFEYLLDFWKPPKK